MMRVMTRKLPIDRRRFLVGSIIGAGTLAAPLSAYGVDASQLGVRAGAPDDQSRAFQRALDQAARTRVPLILGPGVYRAGDLNLAAGAQLFGVRGATRLILTRGRSLLSAEGGDSVTLSGLTIEGGGQALPQNRGLVHFTATKSVRIVDCTIIDAGGNGITLERCDGSVTANTITGADDNAVFCVDNTGLLISGNMISEVRQWRSSCMAKRQAP